MADCIPLEPFLQNLARSGITANIDDVRRITLVLRTEQKWQLKTLRSVIVALLAKNPNQAQVIEASFTEFFGMVSSEVLETGEVGAEGDLKEAETENEAGSAQEDSDQKKVDLQQQLETRWSPSAEHPLLRLLARFRSPQWRQVLYTILVLGGLSVIPIIPPFTPPQPTEVAKIEDFKGRAAAIKGASPGLKTEYDTSDEDNSGKSFDGVIFVFTPAALFCIVALVYYFRYPRLRPRLQDPWSDDDASYYDPTKIGCQFRQSLDKKTLESISAVLAQFKAQGVNQDLHVGKTVTATARQFGVPTLVYEGAAFIKPIYVLVDRQTDTFRWNHLAQQLRDALRGAGFEVRYGHFSGTPDYMVMDDGRHMVWQDFMAKRSEVVFMFTNARGFKSALAQGEVGAEKQSGLTKSAIDTTFSDQRNAHSVYNTTTENTIDWQQPARWPRLFMVNPDIEQHGHFYDSASGLGRVYAVPCTQSGIMQVAQWLKPSAHGAATAQEIPENSVQHAVRSITPQKSMPHTQLISHTQLRDQPYIDANHLGSLEQGLGAAFAWAQACALLQPMTYGLAEALRRHFFGYLHTEHLSKLMLLVGTRIRHKDFSFPPSAVSLLRQTFFARQPQPLQEKILNFILTQIGDTEPENKFTSAHSAWEIIYRRLQLEVDPDAASARLAALSRTSMRPAVMAQMRHVEPNFSPMQHALLAERIATPDAATIPLRKQPKTPDGWRNLAEIAVDAAVPFVQPYPFSRWQWGIIVGIATVMFAGAVTEIFL